MWRHIQRDSDGKTIDLDNALAESYDTRCNGVVSIPISENKINKGYIFSATKLFTGITDASSVEMIGITGDNPARLLTLVKASGEMEIEYEKGTTFTDKGTSVTSVNRNETSDNTSGVNIYHTPTIDTSGTVFAEDLIPGGGQKNASIGGESSMDFRYVVESNSTHLLRVTNSSGADQKIFIKFIWTEKS